MLSQNSDSKVNGFSPRERREWNGVAFYKSIITPLRLVLVLVSALFFKCDNNFLKNCKNLNKKCITTEQKNIAKINNSCF
jgi:hypothetical protein